MAGLVMLWLVMEEVCPKLRADYVVLFSEKYPTSGWVKVLAARGSLVVIQIVRALTQRLKNSGASPLTPLRIAGEENDMTYIPSRSLRSNISWFCKNYTDLLKCFKTNPPFPNQASWTVSSPSNAVSMKVISALQMQHFEMGKWLQLKKAGNVFEKVGVPLSDPWEWSLGYKMPSNSREFGDSQASQIVYAHDDMVEENKLQLSQSLGRSRPLA